MGLLEGKHQKLVCSGVILLQKVRPSSNVIEIHGELIDPILGALVEISENSVLGLRVIAVQRNAAVESNDDRLCFLRLSPQ
jgi:hypothetical protein